MNPALGAALFLLKIKTLTCDFPGFVQQDKLSNDTIVPLRQSVDVATVSKEASPFATVQPRFSQHERVVPIPDSQGWATLIGGSLLILISFITNFSHGDLVQFFSLGIDQQIGVSLHVAALAALVGDVELATRVRHRTANEATRARERTARQTRIQTGCLAAQGRFLLSDTALNRLQLSEAVAILLEDMEVGGG